MHLKEKWRQVFTFAADDWFAESGHVGILSSANQARRVDTTHKGLARLFSRFPLVTCYFEF